MFTQRSMHRAIGSAAALAIATLAPVVWLLLDQDPAALLLMLLPIAPLCVCFAVYMIRRIAAGDRFFIVAMGAILVFLYCANFRFREFEDKSLDFQVVLKLATIAIFLLLGLPPLLRTLRTSAQPDLVLWCAALGILMASSTYAPNVIYSSVAALNLLGCFTFAFYLVRTQDRDTAMLALYAGAVLLAAASLLLYFAAPSFGRMYDWRGEDLVQTARLTGIFTSANNAGSAAALGLLLALILRRRLGRWRFDWLAALILAVCLALTNNKGAMIALAFGVICLYVIERRSGLRITLAVAASAAAALILSAYGDILLALISRSGSSTEVTSATGRDRIWAAVLELWAKEPIFGYGWGASLSILPNHPALFRAATSAHNLYLEVLFASGLFGYLVFLLALALTLGRILRRGAALYLGLFAYLLLLSCSENLWQFPSFTTLGFFLAINLALAERKVFSSSLALRGGVLPAH
ncbi:O-antigen ligase family protein [Methylobacterium oxalidis]|uniref:O-antigen ligase family protein n=1 Tax=Methylobacterium oxalidis TaxID=944322 RepID=UPI003314B2B2